MTILLNLSFPLLPLGLQLSIALCNQNISLSLPSDRLKLVLTQSFLMSSIVGRDGGKLRPLVGYLLISQRVYWQVVAIHTAVRDQRRCYRRWRYDQIRF
jgi:hypothetical protein